jgi:hypothetical protein
MREFILLSLVVVQQFPSLIKFVALQRSPGRRATFVSKENQTKSAACLAIQVQDVPK